MPKKSGDQSTEAINPQTGLRMSGQTNNKTPGNKTVSGTDVDEVKYWNEKSQSNASTSSSNFQK